MFFFRNKASVCIAAAIPIWQISLPNAPKTDSVQSAESLSHKKLRQSFIRHGIKPNKREPPMKKLPSQHPFRHVLSLSPNTATAPNLPPRRRPHASPPKIHARFPAFHGGKRPIKNMRNFRLKNSSCACVHPPHYGSCAPSNAQTPPEASPLP